MTKRTPNKEQLRRLLEPFLYADLSDIIFDFLGFPFIMTFNITHNNLYIPNISSNTTDLFIDWSDGSSQIIKPNNEYPVEHYYIRAGTYTVHITGYINNLYLKNCKELIEISQWGDLLLHSGEKVFKNCSNLTIATNESPNLSVATDLTSMFSRCTTFNSNLSNWNVTNITNMNYMFLDCRLFNCDLSKWDVKNVTSMVGMFEGCNSLNSDLSNWNVSNVNDMRCMFYDCTAFKINLDKWDVKNVINMQFMFFDCTSFKSKLDKWDVSNVQNMRFMFSECNSFDSNLDIKYPKFYKSYLNKLKKL